VDLTDILVGLLRRGIGISAALHLHRTAQRRKMLTYTSRAGFEPTLPGAELPTSINQRLQAWTVTYTIRTCRDNVILFI